MTGSKGSEWAKAPFRVESGSKAKASALVCANAARDAGSVSINGLQYMEQRENFYWSQIMSA